MKNKSLIAKLAASALIAAMTIGTVSSADSNTSANATTSVINVTTESTGIIKYDRNKNGAIDSDDVYFSAEDINSLAQSINALSQNYEALNQKRLDIINAMNATVTKKFYSDSSKTRYDDYSGGADMATTGNLWDSTSDDGALPTTASFDSIVQTLSTLTTPSTATATKYTAATNGWLSGTSSDVTGAAYTGTSSQATTLAEGVTSYVGLNASGESILTLGVNESLTLESGYYSDPVTINNGVVNRGTVSAILTSSDNTTTLPAGYYSSITVSTNITNLGGTITYTHHQCSTTVAGDTYTDALANTSGASSPSGLTTVNGQTVSASKGGCYTTPYYYYSYRGETKTKIGYDDCIVCKGSSVANSCTEGFTRKENCTPHDTYRTDYYTAYAYGATLPSGASIVTTYYTKGCGFTNGQIVSATITY